jgi:hypothetical protein
VLARDATHRDAAILAVKRSVEVQIALDLPEVGQHVVPAPARGAARLPFVVVGRRAAVGQLAVDRGTAAEDARLLVFAQGRALLAGIVVAYDLCRDLELGPVEARIEIGKAGIAVQDLGRLLAGRRVLSRFAKQDLLALLAESLCAMTDPAEPPPMMTKSYRFGIPICFMLFRSSPAHASRVRDAAHRRCLAAQAARMTESAGACRQ